MDGGVKESLNELSTQLIRGEREKREGGIRGYGRVRGDEIWKRKKQLPTSFDLQQQSLFPTVLKSGTYATYKKQQQHVAM